MKIYFPKSRRGNAEMGTLPIRTETNLMTKGKGINLGTYSYGF